MKVEIQSQDFSITESLDYFIHKQIETSMKACSNQIERITVRLKDLNGPKGGRDKACSVEVQIANFPAVIVSKRSSDAYSSIRKAVGRASRVTLRRLKKRKPDKIELRALRLQKRTLELDIAT